MRELRVYWKIPQEQLKRGAPKINCVCYRAHAESAAGNPAKDRGAKGERARGSSVRVFVRDKIWHVL
jgi:hypothetical protein